MKTIINIVHMVYVVFLKSYKYVRQMILFSLSFKTLIKYISIFIINVIIITVNICWTNSHILFCQKTGNDEYIASCHWKCMFTTWGNVDSVVTSCISTWSCCRSHCVIQIVHHRFYFARMPCILGLHYLQHKIYK